MPRLTKEKWLEVKAEYENPTQSVNQLAQDYGISEAAIRKKANKDNWQKTNSESSRIIEEKVRTIKTLHELEEKSSNLSVPEQEKIDIEVQRRLELDELFFDFDKQIMHKAAKHVRLIKDSDEYAASKLVQLSNVRKNISPKQVEQQKPEQHNTQININNESGLDYNRVELVKAQ